MSTTSYTQQQIATQRDIAARSLENDQRCLANLDRVPADVRENHRRTIQMRIDHYVARIAKLDEQLREVAHG